MAQFRIPYEYRSGYNDFAKLSDKQRQTFIKLLSKYSAYTPHQEIANEIASKVLISEVDALNITRALTSLAYAREDSKVSVEQLVNDLRDSFVRKDFTNINTEQIDSVIKSIQDFFNIKGSYYLSNKARQLSFKREKTWTKTRILTDIRPIFTDDESMEIEGEVIIHTIQIDYHHDSSSKTIQLALDSSDLADLKVQIQRAERKESILRENIGKLPKTAF